MKYTATMFLVLLSSTGVSASDKKDISDYYRNKFLVVQREGLAVGTSRDEEGPCPIEVKISGEDAKYRTDGGCGPIPVHKGEILHVTKPYFNSHWAILVVETVTPHQVERGVGAFRHNSLEQGAADIRFKPSGNYDEIRGQIESWVKVYDSKADAVANGGNTASGVQVKQVKEGMTPAEVEAVLGVPDTRADIGSKVIYKYKDKDLTVEFRDGKVVDVR